MPHGGQVRCWLREHTHDETAPGSARPY
jgi:hypothetical protein